MRVLLQLGLLSALLAALAVPSRSAAGGPPKMNLVFILADDLGWSDTTLYGTTKLYDTPNIERLARSGMRFRNAYSANPLCSPTRASILTGIYPGRIGITAPVCHLPEVRLEASVPERGRPDQKSLSHVSATRLKPEYLTLAEVLKDAGYATAHFGKWHLGREPYHPASQGFDSDWPNETAAAGPGGGYLAPWRFIRHPDYQGKPGEHIEDHMAREAAAYIRKQKDRPFYLNYWAYSVHSPWSAKPELVEQYKGRVRPEDKQRNPLYAAMVKSLDDAVGTLLDALREAGVEDRTLVVFTSDNGGWAWQPRQTDPPGYADIPATSNHPLRGGKATLYEGGTREPAVIRWPGKVRPGSTSEALLSSVDYFPTLLEALGVPMKPGHRVDGVSQVPALLAKGQPRDTAYCFFPHYTPATGNIPGTWVRRGDWKLIRFHHDGERGADRHELYHLRDDPGEERDLAGRHPDRVKELDALITAHLSDIRALVPGPNPAYGAAAAPAAPAVAVVQGWRAVRDCSLKSVTGGLEITSTGNDPHMMTRLEPPLPAGEYRVHLRLRSTGRGPGQWFWQEQNVMPAFFRDRSVSVALQHDDRTADYEATFRAAQPVPAVRFDPGTGPGRILLEKLAIRKAGGDLVKEWTLASP